ncbi:DNA repair protein RadC [Treponema rectale]|uniref:DNA repair protein RadC n=1 Tax=Treponema rectale TaxID=744512 RepID=A0A840SCR6_9SPIR|nr:DNA repair protein RadC [Treponema rectale]MBB5217716.1 DNA repair protein RadC [Treponema rectale]QOS40554.1 DNA repair protein RadC [Treponema rectale]
MLTATENTATTELAKPQIRELTLANGMSFPSDEELLMLILGKGTRNCPVEKLSAKVLQVINASNEDSLLQNLIEITGIGISRALTIAAVVEFGKRRFRHLKNVITRSSDLIQYLQHYTLDPVEHFITVTLNGSREILSIRTVSTGTVNKTIVHSREVFAQAVAEHASAIICCHNHPGGTCRPSKADFQSTQVLQEAALVLGIKFLDHIIISREGYFSFLENDLLEEGTKLEKLTDC